jgi:hypothetical protein
MHGISEKNKPGPGVSTYPEILRAALAPFVSFVVQHSIFPDEQPTFNNLPTQA